MCIAGIAYSKTLVCPTKSMFTCIYPMGHKQRGENVCYPLSVGKTTTHCIISPFSGGIYQAMKERTYCIGRASPPPPHCAYLLTVQSKRIMIPFSIQSTIIVQSTHACKLLEGGLNSTFPFFTLNVNKSHVV